MCVLIPIITTAQIDLESKFDSLKNDSRIIYYKEDGSRIGCGDKLGCMPLNVKIYKVTFDKRNNKFYIKGFVFVGSKSKDTVGVGGVAILIGKPNQNKLTNIQLVGKTKEKKDPTIYPYRRGDFEVEFTSGEKNRLYFSHAIYSLVEFNIGKLIE